MVRLLERGSACKQSELGSDLLVVHLKLVPPDRELTELARAIVIGGAPAPDGARELAVPSSPE